MNVKQRIYEHWTTQVLGERTTEERSGCDRGNIAKQDARGTTGHRIDVASRTPGKRGRTVRLFGDEQPLEGSSVTCWNPEETLLWIRWRPLPRK
jgi:hypothetical protein